MGLLVPKPLPELPAFTVTLATGTKAIVTITALGPQLISPSQLTQVKRFHDCICELSASKHKGSTATAAPAEEDAPSTDTPPAKKAKVAPQSNSSADAGAVQLPAAQANSVSGAADKPVLAEHLSKPAAEDPYPTSSGDDQGHIHPPAEQSQAADKLQPVSKINAAVNASPMVGQHLQGPNADAAAPPPGRPSTVQATMPMPAISPSAVPADPSQAAAAARPVAHATQAVQAPNSQATASEFVPACKPPLPCLPRQQQQQQQQARFLSRPSQRHASGRAMVLKHARTGTVSVTPDTAEVIREQHPALLNAVAQTGRVETAGTAQSPASATGIPHNQQKSPTHLPASSVANPAMTAQQRLRAGGAPGAGPLGACNGHAHAAGPASPAQSTPPIHPLSSLPRAGTTLAQSDANRSNATLQNGHAPLQNGSPAMPLQGTKRKLNAVLAADANCNGEQEAHVMTANAGPHVSMPLSNGQAHDGDPAARIVVTGKAPLAQARSKLDASVQASAAPSQRQPPSKAIPSQPILAHIKAASEACAPDASRPASHSPAPNAARTNTPAPDAPVNNLAPAQPTWGYRAVPMLVRPSNLEGQAPVKDGIDWKAVHKMSQDPVTVPWTKMSRHHPIQSSVCN